MKGLCKAIATFLTVLLFFAVAQAQSPAKAQYMFKGKLVDADSGISVGLSHVRNYYKGTITVSNQDGAFTMPVQSGDTLLISRIGYVTLKYAVPAQEPQHITEILLQQKTEELQEVVISKFPTESRFKEQLLGLQLPEEKVALQLPPPPPFTRSSAPEGEMTLWSKEGLVSGIANRFNDKERGRQFKARVEVKEKLEAYIATKFNKEVVQRITGLEDEERLNEFMKFCVLSDDFLYNANEYQIHDAVLGCFKDFLASR